MMCSFPRKRNVLAISSENAHRVSSPTHMHPGSMSALHRLRITSGLPIGHLRVFHKFPLHFYRRIVYFSFVEVKGVVSFGR